MSLLEHAKTEMQRAGLYDKDADYGGAIAKYVEDLMKVFSEQAHSGFSAMYTLSIFDKVARFQALTPITNSSEEWLEVGDGLWQNRRVGSCFSEDGGKTYHNIDEERSLFRKMVPRKLHKLYFKHYSAANAN